MFDNYKELVSFLESQGVSKGDPLNQQLDSARKAQHEYLHFLMGEFTHRHTTKFLKLKGLQRDVPISITYPCELLTALPIVYIRGGGWWNGSLDLSSRLVQDISDASGMPVVCIDFGLAPEYQFPSQVNEICMAIEWLKKSGTSFQLDDRYCVLWAESAGGSLALSVSSKLNTLFPYFFIGHILFYGNFNGPTEVTTNYSKWVWSNYLGYQGSEKISQAVPLQNQIKGVHQAWLAVGSIDPLLNDSRLIHQVLIQKNIKCQLNIMENLPHGFLSYSRLLKPAHNALLQGAKKAYDFSQAFDNFYV